MLQQKQKGIESNCLEIRAHLQKYNGTESCLKRNCVERSMKFGGGDGGMNLEKKMPGAILLMTLYDILTIDKRISLISGAGKTGQPLVKE